jgi:hypothetical protein
VKRIAAVCSTTVGDAGGDNPTPLDELIRDLNDMTHDRSIEHYGAAVLGRDCWFHAYAAERGERQEFIKGMAEVNCPADEQARHLADWDKAERAIAIIHAFELGQAVEA